MTQLNFCKFFFQAYTNTTQNLRGEHHQSWRATIADSPSNSFIQITAIGEAARRELSVGSNASVLIRATEVISTVRVTVS